MLLSIIIIISISFPKNFIMSLGKLILLSLLILASTSQPMGCFKYNSATKSCTTCSKGYYLSSSQCLPCSPECRLCQEKNGRYECLECSESYFKHSTGNCYECSQRVTVNGKDQCREWVIPEPTKSSFSPLSVILIAGVAIAIAYVSTKLYSKYSQRASTLKNDKENHKQYLKQEEDKTSEEKGQEIETNASNSKQSSALTASPEHEHPDILNESKTSNRLISSPLDESLVLQSNIEPTEPITPSKAQSGSQLNLVTTISLQNQSDICYYCKQQNIECQTGCLIDCHIECQIEQYKNLPECFRCKSKEFHCFGVCEECKEYKVKLILCPSDCSEQEHINCYAMLNYQEFCEDCTHRKENKHRQGEREKQE